MNPPVKPLNRRILVIDDNRAIHEDFRKILGSPDANTSALAKARRQFFGAPNEAAEDPGFEINSAYQGEEALALVRQALTEERPYAMAFVDVRMPPGLDGIETTKALWALDPELEVVICTAHSDYSWQQMIASMGTVDRLLILKKPFDPIEVLQLAHSLTKKWTLGRTLTAYLGNLAVMVGERTQQLATANSQLGEQASLLDKAQDAIVVRDPDDTVVFWNASAERLYGWTAEEVIGRNINQQLYLDDTAFRVARNTAYEKGDWIGELHQQTKDGKEIVVEGRWTLVRDDAGRPKSLLAINTDVTGKKKLEAQFLRGQRMESVGMLAGGIAHDLNNVLGPIMMALEILQARFPDAETKQILEILETSTQRGASMIKQVLQFARGAEGERMLVQLGHIVRELRNVATDTFPKTIQIQTTVAQGLALVSADPTQMHQVLLNLCVNARDAMTAGGTLSLGAENVTLDTTYASMVPNAKPGPYVCLQVSDTGTGMSPEVMARMFDPFFTTKAQGIGTGLGLSTTISLVNSHGGFIDVESKVGVGTTFKVYLPAVLDAEAAALVEAPPELPRGHGELIMIIDDEPAVRAITAGTLVEFGYRALTAANGAEACALFAEQHGKVAAVLTDLMMPIMDGPATIRALKRMHPGLPIIAASGTNSVRQVALAQEAGVTRFLNKPYRTEKLLIALRDSLAALPPPLVAATG